MTVGVNKRDGVQVFVGAFGAVNMNYGINTGLYAKKIAVIHIYTYIHIGRQKGRRQSCVCLHGGTGH